MNFNLIQVNSIQDSYSSRNSSADVSETYIRAHDYAEFGGSANDKLMAGVNITWNLFTITVMPSYEPNSKLFWLN